MKKCTKAICVSLYVLLCFIAGGWQEAIAQAALPFPVAHYPLYMDKFRDFHVVQPWDVSGNASHGNTYDATTATFCDSKLVRDSFPDNTGIPCVGKITDDAAWVNIPDPFPALQPNDPFTISFWVYWRNDITNSRRTVIKIPGVQVMLDYNKVTVGMNATSNMILRTSDNVLFTGEGWYFLAVTGGDYMLYLHKYGGVASRPTMGPGTIENPYPKTISRLMDTDFRGKLSQVRFYNTTLDPTQLDAVYKQDVAWATHLQNSDEYVMKNMYSWYTLSGATFNDYKKDVVTRFGNRDATGHANVAPAIDRHGVANGALSFPTLNAYMQLPSFFDHYLDDYVPYNNNKQKGFTISYWVYISPAESSPSGGIELPFTNNDPRQKIFYGIGNGNDLFGMQKIVDRLGIFRYNDIVPNSRYPWYLWLYDPISFRSLVGWFQVVWVQYADWLRMYLFKPDGASVCQSIYLGIQDLSPANITEWGLGNHGGPSTGQTLRLDDFIIYNWPLRPEEVNALHAAQATEQPSITSACTTCGLTAAPAAKDTTLNKQDKGI